MRQNGNSFLLEQTPKCQEIAADIVYNEIKAEITTKLHLVGVIRTNRPALNTPIEAHETVS